MPLEIPVAYDFNCEWCWIGIHQAKRLKEEFGVSFKWLGYEQRPIEDPWLVSPARQAIPNRPLTPSRLDLMLRLESVELPDVERPRKQRTFNAHQAVAFLIDLGLEPDDFIEDVFSAYWEKGKDINDLEVLSELAEPFVGDTREFKLALEEGRFLDQSVHFDADAYKSGVFNIPTFWIGGERYAEQPYSVLREAVRKAAEYESPDSDLPNIYSSLQFPEPPTDRPYIVLNMVETIDGKIILGERDEPVVDLGSKLDHKLMKRIEGAVDAVILGAQTLRAAKKSWNPNAITRIVITRSGDLPFDACFFTGSPIVASETGVETPEGVENLQFPDIEKLLFEIKARGIDRLLLLGGSTLNAQFFERQLIDEIFVTIAPKIKMGRETPTIADGNPLPRENVQNYSIVEQHRAGDELFVRYRRNRG